MKEYCFFKEGKLAFTVNILVGLDHYLNDDEYTMIEHEKLDSMYQYTLVNGVIVKGEQWPVPEPPTE